MNKTIRKVTTTMFVQPRHVIRVAMIAAAFSVPANIAVSDDKDTDEVKALANDTVFGYVADWVAAFGDAFETGAVKHVDLSLVNEGDKTGATGIAVIGIEEGEKSFTFTQLSATRLDGRSTANIGLGHRELRDDETLLVGANVFYDHEFSGKHSRYGVGLEALRHDLGLRLNHYIASSGSKIYKGVTEQALDGTDLTLSYNFNFNAMPTLMPETFLRSYRWSDGKGFKDDGVEYGVRGNFGSNWRFQVSRDDSSKTKAVTTAGLSYRIALGAEPATGATASGPASMRPHLYKPVQRENTIRKSRIVVGLVAVGK